MRQILEKRVYFVQIIADYINNVTIHNNIYIYIYENVKLEAVLIKLPQSTITTRGI